MQLRSSICAAATAFVASAVLVQPASAQIALHLQDAAGAIVSCNTSFPATPMNCGPGFSVVSSRSVTFTGRVGALIVSGLVASSNAPGTSTSGTLSLLYGVRNSSGAAGNLFVDLTGFDYAWPASPTWLIRVRSTGSTTVTRRNARSATFNEAFYADANNRGSQSHPATCTFTLPSPGCTAATEWTRNGGPYSLRLREGVVLDPYGDVTVSTRMTETQR